MPTWGAEWKAQWSDRALERQRETMVSPTLEGLDVQDAEGRWEQWPWDYVVQGPWEPVEFVYGAQSVRIADRTMIDSLHRIAPETKGKFRSPAAKDPLWLFAGYAMAVLSVLGLIWLSIGWAGSWAAMAAPREWEKKLGETAMKQLQEEFETCSNRDLYVAVQSIARRLSATVPPEDGAFDIRVVDEPVLNAMTLPGGYILIFRGLLEAADTPEELAGVMAHEMQHAVQRHSMKALGRSAAIWVIIGMLTGGVDASAGRLAGLRLQREDEFDADEGALRMLEAAKISNAGFLSFFDKLRRNESEVPWLASAFSTHPETGARMERIRQWRASHKETVQPVMETDSWRRVRLSCR